MKNLEKELCKVMHDFVSEHIDEFTGSYDDLAFKDAADMLKRIKSKTDVAIWALMELLDWGLAKNYRAMNFLHEAYATDDDEDVYCIEDSGNKKRFFVIDADSWKPLEVRPKKMKIEVTRWVFK